MCKGSTPTVTAPTIWTRTLWNAQSGQFKSTPSAIQKWEGMGVTMISNMEEVRHTKPQHDPCLHTSGPSYPSCGMGNNSALWIRHELCVNFLNHIP